MQTPLNVAKTHPLSKVARATVGELTAHPIPRQEINPGVANRLERGDGERPYVEEVMRPSQSQRARTSTI